MLTAVPPPVLAIMRRRITVRGQVQGVGFRPYVYRLANQLGLCGWVRNCGEGVEIAVQGPAAAVHAFSARLGREAPPRARVTTLEQATVPVNAAELPFHIKESRAGAAPGVIAPDTAVCGDCLAELFDFSDRRYRHPFINCVDCGPRYTIAHALPFDRQNTSMAKFAPCPACRGEYENPLDRRFHAQTTACPSCGPRLSLHDGEGGVLAESDILSEVLKAIRAGGIVALKGLGGFHLLCDARNADAVARLRVRKGREAKPLAVMAANVASSLPWARSGDGERYLLESPQRPIVLLEKTADCDRTLAGVAPDIGHVGVMLPYTPLHYLLFHQAAGRPAGTAWLQQPQAMLLVCTSANPVGEPLVIDNHEALARLKAIADVFVTHDRGIAQRCDDSVMKPTGAAPLFIRRARGFVPQPITLPRSGPAVLAFGGDLKNTLCLTQGHEAYVSQHHGDLDNPAACRNVESALGDMIKMLDIAPCYVVHDRHPRYFSSRLARRFAAQHHMPCIAVQHHHAHVAAVMAEHGLAGPVLGIALDGLGWGDDHGLWGGELLRVEGAGYRRVGHLARLALPGGDRAARAPWRMAASALHALGRSDEIRQRFPHPGCEVVMQMLDKGVQAPLTSSAGRWFDAAAGLLGVADHAGYEGHAAMQLEALAMRHGRVESDEEAYDIGHDGTLNLLPLLARLADEQETGFGAALFHGTLVAALSAWVSRAVLQEGVRDVVLSGGCFMNGILSAGLREALRASGLSVYAAHQLPPNDGGLSLGQAWVGLRHALGEGR